MNCNVMVSRHRNANGESIPDCIYFNGAKFVIKAILDTVFSQEVIIYTVLIRNCVTHLYADPVNSLWYVKAKVPAAKTA